MATVTITLKPELPDDVDLSWVPEEPVVLTGEQAFSQAAALTVTSTSSMIPAVVIRSFCRPWRFQNW